MEKSRKPRKPTKVRLGEVEQELEKLKKQYSEEIKAKTHSLFVKNKLESLLDDENYMKILEDVIKKSADDYKATLENNNI